MATLSKTKQNQRWRENNPEYHIQNYEKNKDKLKIRRFNALTNSNIPEDSLPYIRKNQNGACAVCKKPIKGREYLFLKSHQDVEILCISCRRIRNEAIKAVENEEF